MYFPKSLIKSNLYTNGGEYAYSSNKKEYKGYYFKVVTGKYYTEKSPSPRSQELIPINLNTGNPLNRTFPDYKGPTITSTFTRTDDIDFGPEYSLNPNPNYFDQKPPLIRYIPQSTSTPPTEENYNQGRFFRYFCKKNNELLYKEITQSTYNDLNQKLPLVAWDLYTPVKIPWLLTGDKNYVYTNNKQTVQKIEQFKKWYGFTQYFNDKFLKYYLAS